MRSCCGVHNGAKQCQTMYPPLPTWALSPVIQGGLLLPTRGSGGVLPCHVWKGSRGNSGLSALKHKYPPCWLNLPFSWFFLGCAKTTPFFSLLKILTKLHSCPNLRTPTPLYPPILRTFALALALDAYIATQRRYSGNWGHLGRRAETIITSGRLWDLAVPGKGVCGVRTPPTPYYPQGYSVSG